MASIPGGSIIFPVNTPIEQNFLCLVRKKLAWSFTELRRKTGLRKSDINSG
jgi:hypothetical protein